jgi:hypothetical protein
MRIRMRIPAQVAGVLAVLRVLALCGYAGPAQAAIRDAGDIDGFRNLPWGTSIEQASKTYRDLDFERYEVADGKEEPLKVFVRKGEQREIEDVAFDSVEYRFRKNHFFQVRASLHSRVGPRTLVTKAENAFGKIAGRLRDRYGAPSGQKTDYLTEFIVVVKEATWIVDRSWITIRYEGAGKTNEDLLTLILQERPGR